jgi:hypothetical protein
MWRRSQKRWGPEQALNRRGRLIEGPARGVDGAAPASPSSEGSGGGRGSDAIVNIWGTVYRREDPRSASLGGVEGSGSSVDQGPKEHPASGRSDGRAVAGVVGGFWSTGV